MDSKEYEQLIRDELASRYPEASVTWNAVLRGRSGIDRQIDVLLEDFVVDAPVRMVVDAKLYRSRVDVNDVEAFLGMLKDVEAHRGMIVTSLGYTKGALQRAQLESMDVELDLLSIADLSQFQADAAIPFSGDHGVLLRAPFGWVVDGTRRQGWVANLYQRGRSFEEAVDAWEWAYANFWRREGEVASLEQLQDHQEAGLRSTSTDSEIQRIAGPTRSDARTAIRLAKVSTYPALELTGFVEFKEVIFFVVVFTNELAAKRDLRKLREILRSVLFIGVAEGLRDTPAFEQKPK